jgi:hypothetical protein
VLTVVMSAALLILGSTTPAAAATRNFTGFGLTGNGQGYLLVSSTGEFYAYGNARPWPNAVGSSGIVGVAVTADGQGALAVSGSGQFYAYGTAHPWTNIVGSSGIVGVAVTADGQGALAVSRTGQFYAYGTAHAWTNPTGFTNRITSVAITADGQGAVAMSDRGQFYAYGSARPQNNPTGFTGSMVGVRLTADGQGLTAMSSSGQIYAYSPSAWLGNGDPGSATPGPTGTAAQRIVSTARAEAANGTRNRERVGTNCNYYTGQMSPGAAACAGGWRSQQWCADFANWVLQQVGVRTTGNAAAASFYKYGKDNRTWKGGASTANARVGDAVVFELNTAGTFASHVGLVTAVNSNGTITYVSGNTGNPAGGADGVLEKTIDPTRSGVSGYTSLVG